MSNIQQVEMLNLIRRYNTADRNKIKENLFHIVHVNKIQRNEIANDCGFKRSKIDGWLNRRNPNVPLIEDALYMANKYDFSLEDLIN